jgi:tetratricopeptide (TPR) repeat protein
VDREGRVVLTDFGLASMDSLGGRLTKSNAVLGTPDYMAPEQVSGKAREIDARTDVYALGVMLYEILSGETPFGSSSLAEVYRKILETDARTLPGPAGLVALKAMSKEPERRYATAAEFAEDLARATRGEPVRAGKPSVLFHLRKFLRRRIAILAVAAIALMAAAGAVLFLRFREFARDRDEAREAHRQGDWRRALAAAERALEIRKDGELSRLREDCLRQIDEEREAARRREEEAEAYRKIRGRIRSVEIQVADARAAAYVEGGGFRAKAAAVEAALAELEGLDHRDVWTLLGMGWYVAGDFGRAERALRKAEELGTLDDWGNYYLGRIYLERSMLALMSNESVEVSRTLGEKAREYLSRPSRGWSGAGENDRRAAEGYLALARREFERARAIAEEGLQRHRGMGTEDFWNLKGYVEGLSDRRKQIAAYTEAIKARPQYAWGYFMRGVAHGQLNERDPAIADYDAAIRIQPRFAEAFNNRAIQKLEKRDFDGALADFDDAVRLRSDWFHARINRSVLRQRKGDLAGARADLDALVRDFPELPAAWNNRGTALQALGDKDAAAADFRKAIALDAKYFEPRLNLADLSYERGDLETALAQYTAALAIRPDDVRALLGRGQLYVAQGELRDALRDVTRVIEISPDMAAAYVNRAGIHVGLRNPEAAMADAEKAISLDVRHPGAYVVRATLRHMYRDVDGALEDLDTAISLDPNQAEALGSRGMIREARGDVAGALADYKKALEVAPKRWLHRETIRKRAAALENP